MKIIVLDGNLPRSFDTPDIAPGKNGSASLDNIFSGLSALAGGDIDSGDGSDHAMQALCALVQLAQLFDRIGLGQNNPQGIDQGEHDQPSYPSAPSPSSPQSGLPDDTAPATQTPSPQAPSSTQPTQAPCAGNIDDPSGSLSQNLDTPPSSSANTPEGLKPHSDDTQGNGLKNLAAQCGMYFGGAVCSSQLNDPAFTQQFKKNFGVATSENDMKWEATDKGYEKSDAFVNWAQKNNLGIRGHTLLWHSQAPERINGMNGNELKGAITDHINGMVKRYGDKVKTWDVANEFLSDNPNEKFRQSQINDKVGGQQALDLAFKTAHKANPKAQLVYNDYNVETINAKSDHMLSMVKDMKARGIPIHAVGFQAHLKVGQDLSSMRDNIARFRAAGVDVQLTELDIAGGSAAQKAATFGQTMQAAKSGGAQGVSAWGMYDGHSWIGQDPGLPLDNQMNVKLAYRQVLKKLAS